MTRKYFPFCFYVLVSVLCLGKPSSAYPSGSLGGGGAIPAVDASSETDSATIDSITPLKIGDKIPDELWDYAFPVVSPHSDQVQYLTLGDFRDKLIILDFWATWCAPCISSLHKLDTLQQEFAGDLLVFPTSYEAQDKVTKFFADKGWSLPTAFDETHLKEYFPHRSIPHQVWIKGGEVMAIAGPEYASRENILSILKGEQVKMVAKEEDVGFDKSKPIDVTEENRVYQSSFTNRINAQIGGYRRRDNGITIYNLDLLGMLRLVYEDRLGSYPDNNRIIWEIDKETKDRMAADSSITNPSSAGKQKAMDWLGKNTYSYTLEMPKRTDPQLVMEIFKTDLARLLNSKFEVEASIEKRKVRSLVIHRVDKDNPTFSDQRIKPRFTKDGDTLTFINQPFDHLVKSLVATYYKEEKPFIDKSRYQGKMNLKIVMNPNKLKETINVLNSRGITIMEQEIEIEVLVISRKDKN
ncbi:TlpA disulfide reductase family protein [Albibacterium indicum]|uniref:TlpA disulfide reductase family protein n=1 Tax=Albibacterium indicum TaxID=2292082 RepID=UPI000E5342F4|nr:TlpA disulfide reductase family protein [Pedobacter indicus]